MSRKLNSALVLGLLVVALLAVGVSTPDLAYFMGGEYDSMFAMGKDIGKSLATALSMPILELVGIVLFIA